MLRDVEPFERVWRAIRGDSSSTEAITSFVHFLEKKLGAEMLYDASLIPSSDLKLVGLFELAEKMRDAGIVLSWRKSPRAPDEPPVAQWHAHYREGDESRAGGSAVDDEGHALVCTLAESLERHLWYEATDYFKSPKVATVRQIESTGPFVRPESFAGYSDEQKKQNKNLRITPESVYVWIKATSLTTAGEIWIPAQTISPHADAQKLVRKNMEPSLRRVVTTGLATHPLREEALLGGALEIIERDAYMIMWLNQLTLPRVNLDDLSLQDSSLKTLVERCRRYRLRPHIIRMITDAPTHAFCAILEDESGLEPRVAVGMKAHRNPARCAEKALLEALRARRGARNQLSSLASDTPRPQKAAEVGHYDRLAYWGDRNRHMKLAFLYNGPLEKINSKPWERDSAKEHLNRITQWCRERAYDFVSVPLTNSKKNITPWHVEMAVIPQLQPLYYSETLQPIGSERLATIPALFGYKPRAPLFTDEPHPFA